MVGWQDAIPKESIAALAAVYGDLTKKVTVTAHRFSKSAVTKIEKAGGKAIVLAPPAKAKADAESPQKNS